MIQTQKQRWRKTRMVDTGHRREHVFVTGAEGFIGSHIVETLLSKGCKVNAFVLYNSFSATGWLTEINDSLRKNLTIYFGDVRDQQTIEEALQGCDSIVHLASLITIPYSYTAPVSYFETNVKGTINVLNAARNQNIERIVHTSTSEVYGTAQIVPIPESHPLVGQSPYSASKIGADQVAYSFFTSFGLPIVTARPFNTFGPRQSARAVIPTIMSQIIAGQTELHLGDTSTTRDFNYVSDTVKGIITLLEGDTGCGEVFNIGSGFEISIGNLLKKIENISGINLQLNIDENRLRPANSEVQRLCANNNKICEKFGWKPDYAGENGLERALKKTFDWLSERQDIAKTYSAGYKV